MKRRIFATVLSSLMIAMAFAGCGKDAGSDNSKPAAGSNNSGKIELEFFQQQGEEAIQAGYEVIIADFQKENPDIVIKQNTVPDSLKVLASRIATDDIPPLLTDWPTQMQFKEKVKNGYYEKLTGQEFFSQVNEDYLAMTPADDGEYYAMPYARNYMAVFYNMDMFEENDIEIPTTWDEFIAVCDTFKEKGITPLNFPLKDGVGHIFQATTVAFVPDGVEELVEVQEGKTTLSENAEYKADFSGYADKMMKLMEYGNEDAFGMSTTMMQESFANGNCAMIISGSYGRGNILLANPDMRFGAFALPGDTVDSTTCLTGVNAALCVSAQASEEEKEAAFTFLNYISQTEVAQKWSDESGEPSIIAGTEYADENFAPILNFIDEKGQVHDWMASTLQNNVVNELYNTVQSFLLDKPSTDQFLKNMDDTIAASVQ